MNDFVNVHHWPPRDELKNVAVNVAVAALRAAVAAVDYAAGQLNFLALHWVPAGDRQALNPAMARLRRAVAMLEDRAQVAGVDPPPPPPQGHADIAPLLQAVEQEQPDGLNHDVLIKSLVAVGAISAIVAMLAGLRRSG